MCQQILKFCSSSAKPLLIVGSSLTLLLAIVIGFTGCTTHALYEDIDPTVAQSRSLGYHLQLAASGYCFLVALLGYYTAFYNQKHAIRALALITAINCVFALATIAMVPTGAETTQLFEPKLKQLVERYDFSNKWPVVNETTNEQAVYQVVKVPLISDSISNSSTMPQTLAQDNRLKRGATIKEITKEEATKIWDLLQLRGCCGLRNATDTWKSSLPKSCCSKCITDENGQQICKTLDEGHQKGCLELISTTSFNLIIVLALISLANLYLAAISGMSAYRTFHYDEASQSAYN